MNNIKASVENILNDVTTWGGSPDLDSFSSLRDVDAKVRELKLILNKQSDKFSNILDEINNDPDFAANSRRVRLEALANYCKTILRLIDNNLVNTKKILKKAPNISALTGHLNGLEEVINARWFETQKCMYAGAYLSAVIMMGSILEALILARAYFEPQKAYTANRCPKNKDGSSKPLQDWNLNSLIEVAGELNWIKTDRMKFSHALRESRNAVHPWAQVSLKLDYDQDTYETCWQVLNASVRDLLESIKP